METELSTTNTLHLVKRCRVGSHLALRANTNELKQMLARGVSTIAAAPMATC